jgi:hypothetical protein
MIIEVGDRKKSLNEHQLTDDLRIVWGLVSEEPGIATRKIGRRLNWTHAKARKIVDLFIESETLTAAPGKQGTLRATVPLFTIRIRNAD